MAGAAVADQRDATTAPPAFLDASGGETLRKLTGCLIAVVAMRNGASLLHRDHDFEVITRHVPLRLAT